MIKVNLVPAEILAKAQQKQQMLQVLAAGVLGLLVVIAISFGHWYSLKRLQIKYESDQAELRKLEVIVAKVEELEKTAQALKARFNVIKDLLRARRLYPHFMSDFARSVPSGVWVKSLSTMGGGSDGSPVKLAIGAEARSGRDIADWVATMSGMQANARELVTKQDDMLRGYKESMEKEPMGAKRALLEADIKRLEAEKVRLEAEVGKVGRFDAIELGAVTTADGAERTFSFTLSTIYTPSL